MLQLRILLVDDHEVVREGLRSAFRRDPRFLVVADASSGRDALAAAHRDAPDVAVVDMRLPDMDGVDLCEQLRRGLPRVRVIVLSTFVTEDALRRAAHAGASAFVSKDAGLAELRKALEWMRTDPASAVSPQPSERILRQLREIAAERAAETGLSPRRQRVLELAAEGLTDRQIGECLFISESTVRFHLQKLKKSLGAQSKTDLIAKALRQDLIAPVSESTTPADHG